MNSIIKKNGINFGLIMGIFSILVTTLIYAIDISLFVNPMIGISSIVIYLILGIWVVSKTKKELNKSITFKEAFTVYFLAAAIGATLSVVFNIILFNYIDPAAKDTIRQLTIDYTVDMLRKFSTPTATIKETVEKLKESDNYSIVSQLKGLVFSLVFSAIFGAILALIFKNRTNTLE
ncbi:MULTISPECIES: DUF4199 domain-containing protein [Flavobacterium]|uniref:DUF4199 domain-containing protein n=1 Tax=Flavobacterium TaxID=237 RepID=UPI00086BE583|nr:MULTISPECIES: DUF4199 domain-containing protein [Flavobacterium]MBN9283141.1 DUF4199 domain-containing protein [Flavobacterium sp.]ODS86644.1 MAG: hypothetical protein ABS44_13120 [Chryseobacterium sp. SCN 40-13]OJV67767.1 MAG: hypothetical protein BGO42_17235 [Flavobacterium sp. 40-81]